MIPSETTLQTRGICHALSAESVQNGPLDTGFSPILNLAARNIDHELGELGRIAGAFAKCHL
jgi:hypothetical protein